MLCNGHEGEIYTARFSLDGSCFASAGFDMRVGFLFFNIFLDCYFLFSDFPVERVRGLREFRGDQGSLGRCDGHQLQHGREHHRQCLHGQDRPCLGHGNWRLSEEIQVRFVFLKCKFWNLLRSHSDIVNAVHPARRGPQLICSASDDGCAKVTLKNRRKVNRNNWRCTTSE